MIIIFADCAIEIKVRGGYQDQDNVFSCNGAK